MNGAIIKANVCLLTKKRNLLDSEVRNNPMAATIDPAIVTARQPNRSVSAEASGPESSGVAINKLPMTAV